MLSRLIASSERSGALVLWPDADFHFHDLRHTAATRMADAGADPFTLAAILGHSDIRMTARYALLAVFISGA